MPSHGARLAETLTHRQALPRSLRMKRPRNLDTGTPQQTPSNEQYGHPRANFHPAVPTSANAAPSKTASAAANTAAPWDTFTKHAEFQTYLDANSPTKPAGWDVMTIADKKNWLVAHVSAN